MPPKAWSAQHQQVVSDGALFLTYQLQLRSFLNSILHDLYIPSKAYAMPQDLAALVESWMTRLEQWMCDQPFEPQRYRPVDPETVLGFQDRQKVGRSVIRPMLALTNFRDLSRT